MSSFCRRLSAPGPALRFLLALVLAGALAEAILGQTTGPPVVVNGKGSHSGATVRQSP